MARKSKKKGLRYWKDKLWDEVSIYVRMRSALETTGSLQEAKCCTCQAKVPIFGKNCIQAGHFIPGRGNSVLFDIRGIFAQCYNCNCNLKGNWPKFYAFMKKRYSEDVVESLIAEQSAIKIYKPVELEEMLSQVKAAIILLSEKRITEAEKLLAGWY